MFSLKNVKLSPKKNSYEYGSKKNRKILKRIKGSLPELMSRNLKLAQELKDKLAISSFMNDTETKSQKYLQQFLLSSQNRVSGIKTGIGLSNVIKDGTKKIDNICNHINDDIIIKNCEFLLNEKKLMNQKIAKVKHYKINELIKNIKYIIKPNKIKRKTKSYRIVKSVPEEEMIRMKNIINKELTNDEKLLKEKINFYKQNLSTLAEKDHKKFRRIASNLYLKSNLRLINYSKFSKITNKGQKTMNLLTIRRHLLKSKEEKGKNDENETDNNIYDDNYFLKTKNITSIGDTMSIIKNMAKEKNSLEIKTKNNLKRINSMIDIKLPHFSNYQKTISFRRFLSKNMNATTTGLESKKENIRYKIKFKNNAIDKLELIKSKIKELTHDNIRKKFEEIEKSKNINQFYK